MKYISAERLGYSNQKASEEEEEEEEEISDDDDFAFVYLIPSWLWC